RPAPPSLLPSPTLFRSHGPHQPDGADHVVRAARVRFVLAVPQLARPGHHDRARDAIALLGADLRRDAVLRYGRPADRRAFAPVRSEEHTSELQSRENLV